MFFGVAEPVMHFLNPPRGDAATLEAARKAMGYNKSLLINDVLDHYEKHLHYPSMLRG